MQKRSLYRCNDVPDSNDKPHAGEAIVPSDWCLGGGQYDSRCGLYGLPCKRRSLSQSGNSAMRREKRVSLVVKKLSAVKGKDA